MEREQFKKIIQSLYRDRFNESRYLRHLFLDDADGISECRVILKKIENKIERVLAEWDAAENKEDVEAKICMDDSLYKCTESEKAQEKIKMAAGGLNGLA